MGQETWAIGIDLGGTKVEVAVVDAATLAIRSFAPLNKGGASSVRQRFCEGTPY